MMKKLPLCITLGMFFLSGCAIWRFVMNKGERKQPPKLFYLPFNCENTLIGAGITDGFAENLSKKIQGFDLKEFQLVLSSHPVSFPAYTLAESTRSAPKESALILDLERLVNDLFEKDSVRENFYLQTKMDYVMVGRAQEKPLGELELGNLVTAQTAQMKLLELKSGVLLLDEHFKQGFFEIIAPDRIGKKFASKVNSKIKQIAKEIKKANKIRSKRRRRRR